jgi:hypothetical protein
VKPVTEENPLPTNNAYIYSFYAKMVGLNVPFLDDDYYWINGNRIKEQLQYLDTAPLTRHPKKSENTVPISHDEYVGVAGLKEFYANRIVKYGEKNYWQFCDIPNFKPTPFRKLVLDDVMAAYEGLANDKETNVRKAIVKYPALFPLAFWHRPNQQYFYYRCALRTPGFIRTLYFSIATLVSIAQNDPRNVMLGFKFIKFESIGLNFIEKMLYKVYKKRVNFVQNCKNYFPADHPILKRVLAL